MIKFNVKKSKNILVASSALLLACTLNVSAMLPNTANTESIKKFNTLVKNVKTDKSAVDTLIESIKNASKESELSTIAQKLENDLGALAQKLTPMFHNFIYVKTFSIRIKAFVEQYVPANDTFDAKAFNNLKEKYQTLTNTTTATLFNAIFNTNAQDCLLNNNSTITATQKTQEAVKSGATDILDILTKITSLLNPILNISEPKKIKTFLDAKLCDLQDGWDSELTVSQLLESYIDQIQTITEKLENDFANKIVEAFESTQNQQEATVDESSTKNNLTTNTKGIFGKLKNLVFGS